MDPLSKSLIVNQCLTVCRDREDNVDERSYNIKCVDVKMYVEYIEMSEGESQCKMEIER